MKDKDEFVHFLEKAKSYLLDENICFHEEGVKGIIKGTYGSSLIKEKVKPKKLKTIYINKPATQSPSQNTQNINYENINASAELKKIELLKDGYNKNIVENNSDIIQKLETVAQLNEQSETEVEEASFEPISRAEKLIYKKVFGCEFDQQT